MAPRLAPLPEPHAGAPAAPGRPAPKCGWWRAQGRGQRRPSPKRAYRPAVGGRLAGTPCTTSTWSPTATAESFDWSTLPADGRFTMLASTSRPALRPRTRGARTGKPDLHLALWNPYQALDIDAPGLMNLWLRRTGAWTPSTPGCAASWKRRATAPYLAFRCRSPRRREPIGPQVWICSMDSRLRGETTNVELTRKTDETKPSNAIPPPGSPASTWPRGLPFLCGDDGGRPDAQKPGHAERRNRPLDYLDRFRAWIFQAALGVHFLGTGQQQEADRGRLRTAGAAPALGLVALALHMPFLVRRLPSACWPWSGLPSATHDHRPATAPVHRQLGRKEAGRIPPAGPAPSSMQAASFPPAACWCWPGYLEKTSGITTAWTIVFCILGAMLAALGLYKQLGVADGEKKRARAPETQRRRPSARTLVEVILAYFKKPGIWVLDPVSSSCSAPAKRRSRPSAPCSCARRATWAGWDYPPPKWAPCTARWARWPSSSARFAGRLLYVLGLASSAPSWC